MEEPPSTGSIGELLASAEVKAAAHLELSLFDVVHFRLLRPSCVFELVEARLLQRDPDHFRGYAQVRQNIESAMRTEPVIEKAKACCFRNSKWSEDHAVLYSTELEVWMDLSYPNPWALELYQRASIEAKSICIPKAGPFSALFHELLLQKNGFERVHTKRPKEKTLRVLLGFPRSGAPGTVHLIPEVPDQRPHAISDGLKLGERLASGVIIKDRELGMSRDPDPKKRYLRDIGFRLIGPSLVVLIQSLAKHVGPIAFIGTGSTLMNDLIQHVRPSWPWVPEIVVPDNTTATIAILPEAEARFSLLPGRIPGGPEPVFSLKACHPSDLLVPAMTELFRASLSGEVADRIQAGIRAFVDEYARASRGLELELGIETIILQWRQQILSPKDDFLSVIQSEGVVPGLKGPMWPWKANRNIQRGPWPTGAYLSCGPLSQIWLHISSAGKVAEIQRWQNELEQRRPEGGLRS